VGTDTDDEDDPFAPTVAVGYSVITDDGDRAAPVTYDDGRIGWRPIPEPATLWARFTPDDVKLFCVTLAATGVANVGTVMVVAFAVIYDRYHSHDHGALSHPTALSGALLLVMGIAGFAGYRFVLRRTQPGLWYTVLTYVVTAYAVAIGLALLVLLGFAAGLK
jgi:hypothetical protein